MVRRRRRVRRRTDEAGYDPAAGEKWIVNELDHTTIRDSERDIVRALLAGLYYGAPGMQPLPGIVLP